MIKMNMTNEMKERQSKILSPLSPMPRSLFGGDFFDRISEGWNTAFPANLMRRDTREDGTTILEYNLAGFTTEDIKVKLDSALGELIITAKKDTEENKRSFSTILTLSPYTTPEDISTHYENGVLEIMIAPLEKRKEESLIDIAVT
jgi:HSP20 family molecular chaperone IbpA